MIWLDYTLIALILVSALVSLMRGLVREILSLVGWVVAFWVGLQFSPKLGAVLADGASVNMGHLAVAFIILFLMALLFLGLFNRLVSIGLRRSGLSGFDRAAGVAFGILRGLMVVVVIVTLVGMTPLAQHQVWRNAITVNYTQSMILAVKTWLPKDGAQGVFAQWGSRP